MLISNKYKVESLLGKGSMGEVYMVRHVALGSLSALKVLPSRLIDSPDLLTRFYREARVMAKLIHPNIVRVIDIDHDDELKFHYFVMEFIHGPTLRDYLEEKKVLTLREILSIARQIGNALQFAHNNDPPVIHRDIKPSNIMLEHNTNRVVLMDFGIAKELDEANMTRCEMMLGTVRYCPREQMLYEPLDGSADIYALGMIMYEAYTGDHFFAGLNENQVISAVLSEEENEPTFNESTPTEFKTLITKAIAKKRANRYHEMSEFLRDLEICWTTHIERKESNSIYEINPDNIKDLDEHIQKLNLEKQRRSALTNKTNCEEAKEKAIQQGADQSAKDSFLEGCRQESSGNEYMGQKKYALAQEAYLTAVNLFSNAFQKASLIRLHEQAEQSKQDVQAIKTEADGYNARKNARTFYGRALNIQSQAEESLENLSYQDAYEKFSEAFRIYQDARELAYYKSLKDDAEVLSARVKEAYDEAVKADAKVLAPTLFRKAIEIEQKAKTAFSAEDFPQANQLYRNAIENYSLARRQVLDLQKQLEILKARKQALDLWHKARQSGAEQRFAAEFAEALKLKEQGQYWESQQNPEEAADHYNKAANAFEQLQNETESLVARDQVEVIKQQLDNAKAKFQTLRTCAKEAWAEADAMMEQADSACHDKQYPQAQKIYIRALEAYTQAQQKSIAEQCNEQVQLPESSLQESQRVANHCEVEKYCQSTYQNAIDAQAKGQKRLKNGKHQDAFEYFKKARGYFEQAVFERRQQLKLEINALQQQAKDIQAQDYASTLYHKGLVSLLEAEEFWEQSCHDRSYDSYCESYRLFKEACEITNLRIIKEEAEDFQEQAREAFDEAVALDAEQRFSGLLQQALQSQELADEAFRKENYVEAKNLYGTAVEQFARVREKGLELVKAAQNKADEIQRLVRHAGVSVEQDACQQALLSYQSGEDYLNQKAYRLALPAFEAAHAKYKELWNKAEKEHKFQNFLAAKERADKESLNVLKVETVKRNSKEFIEAAKLMEQAHQWSGLKNYEKASVLYEKAADLFLQLSSGTLSRQKLEQARERVLTVQKQLKPYRYYIEKLWNKAENIKNKAEKAGQANEYNQALDLYEEAYNAFNRAKADAENQLAEIKRANEDKTIVVNSGVDKKQRGLSGFSRIKRWTVSILMIILFVTGGFMIFDLALVKSLFVAITPQSELTITKVMPSEEFLSLEDGHSQTFAVKVSDKKKTELDYTWYLDGKEQAKGEQWIYAPVFNASETASKEIKVVITDQKELSLEKIWKVNVISQTGESKEKTINHAPRIVKTDPSEQNLMLTKKEAIVFSVEVNDEDPDDLLAYSWTLDGVEVSNSMAWIYKSMEEGKHEVALTVTDKLGSQDEHVWSITSNIPVKNHPPRIVKTEPSEQKIELAAGSSINFLAEATGSDSKGQLTYTWYADRQKQSSSKTWLYRVPSEGQHKISLKVADQDGRQTYRSWNVTARAPSSVCVYIDETSGLCLPDSSIAEITGSEDKQTGKKTETGSRENHAPSIIKTNPSEQQLELLLGKITNFSVEASDVDPDDQLTYVWSLDGQQQATSNSWNFLPQTEGQQKVSLKVSDKAGKSVQRTWFVVATAPPATCIQVEENSELCLPSTTTTNQEVQETQQSQKQAAKTPVQKQPPRIIKTNPSEQKLELYLGATINFSVEAMDNDPDDQLTYTWFLDGNQESSGSTWLYKPETEGQYRIALEVADRTGKLAQRTWFVTASAPPATCITLEDNSELCMPSK